MSLHPASLRSDRVPPRGFSLVELLVVMSIVSLLIAMLLPSLSRAREVAKRSQCLSQLRQVGMAALMYSGDFDGAYPVHYRGPTNSYGVVDGVARGDWDPSLRRGFYLLAGSYVSGYDTWFCPSNQNPGFSDRDAFTPPAGATRSARGGYMYRYQREDGSSLSSGDGGFMGVASPDIGQRFASGHASVGYPVGYVVPPSRAAYAADQMGGYRTGPLQLGVMGQTHVEGVNAAFFDGHGAFRDRSPLEAFPSPGTWSSDSRVYERAFIFMIDIQRP